MSTLPDLGKFDIESASDRGAKLELLDKTGKKSGEWIQLLGADSKAYQDKLAEHNRNRLARITARQSGLGSPRFSQDDIVNETIERLAVCTKAWSFKTGDGNDFPCTPENVELMYRKSVVIREQVEAFVNERANFLGN